MSVFKELMSIFKEGYFSLHQITSNSIQIFSDAADFGAPTKKNDRLWKLAGQVFKEYGSDRVQSNYSTGKSVKGKIKLFSEADNPHKEVYVIEYVTCKTGACKGHDGYLTVYKE